MLGAGQDVVNKILNFPSRSIDLDTGMEISLTEAKERQNILQEFISKAGKGLNKVGKKSERLFITRNIFLLLGLLCLIISKFISLCVVYQNV